MKRRRKKFHVDKIPFDYGGKPVEPVREDEVLKAHRRGYKAVDNGPGFSTYKRAETLNTSRNNSIQNNLSRGYYQDPETFRFRPLSKTSDFNLRLFHTPTPISSRLQMIRSESLNSLYLPGDQYYTGMVQQRDEAYNNKLTGPMIGKDKKLSRAVSHPAIRDRMSRTTNPTIFTRQQEQRVYEQGMPKTHIKSNKTNKVYRFPLVSFNETRMRRANGR